MAVEGLLEGERRMSTAGRAWPMLNGHDPLVLALLNGDRGLSRLDVAQFLFRGGD